MEIQGLNPPAQVTSHIVETNLRHGCLPTPDSYFTSSLLSLQQGEDAAPKSRGCFASIFHVVLEFIDSLLSCLGFKKTRTSEEKEEPVSEDDNLRKTPSPDSLEVSDDEELIVINKGEGETGESE